MGWLTVHTLSTVRTSIHTLSTVRAWQTNERKESMCFQLRDAMRVGNICFSDEFFSTTSSIREVKQVLEDELRNFCILVEVRALRGHCPELYALTHFPCARSHPRRRSAK